jgi:2-polyprenyl-3-methyl-5-hydroxy-6-metoxy-1,4-benzoquinol methylase
MDETQMMEFVSQAVADVGALLSGAMVVLGDKLGLYQAMAGTGSVTSAELAARTGTTERYIREWLCAQAARGYVTYDGDGRFSLPDEHAVPLTDETSPACVIGAFEIALGSVYATDKIAERFRSGGGFAWGAHDEHVLDGCERFFRPGYLNNLASAWIPALDGVEAKLAAGARVADVGCGHGASTLLLAQAYPVSAITGFDAHDGSIEAARKRAADAGLAERVHFEVASAATFSGTYDLRAHALAPVLSSRPAGRSCSSSPSPATTSPAISTRSAPPTTASQLCSARRVPYRRTPAPRSAHRPVRPGCARSSPVRDSARSGG